MVFTTQPTYVLLSYGQLSALNAPPLVVPADMNYGKKDEDADTGLVKVDRTQVFQEGKPG